MPIFEVQGPDGQTYEVDAPSAAAAATGFKRFSAPSTPQPSPSQLGVPMPENRGGYTGSVLPFSTDPQGRARFDSNAGILGSMKRAFETPGDVATGKLDPYSVEGQGRVMELAGLAAPINPAIRAGDRAVPGMARNLQQTKAEVPTVPELRGAATAGYDAVRDAGVDYSSNAVSKVAQALKMGLEKDGILAELAPKTHSIVDRLSAAPPNSVAPISGLDAARRSLNRLGKSLDGEEREAARRAVEGIDNFITAADPAAVVAGDAAAAGRTLVEARGNYAASKRAGSLAERQDAAELRAAAANSGANTDNAIRQRIASLLLNPKAVRGFSEGEKDALTGVVEGTAGRNVARTVGNALGGGGGLGSVVTGMAGAGAGSAAFGPLGAIAGAAAPIVGAAAKQTGNALTRRALSGVDEMVRMRSPLYEQRVAASPLEGSPVAAQDLIARLLMEQQLGGR